MMSFFFQEKYDEVKEAGYRVEVEQLVAEGWEITEMILIIEGLKVTGHLYTLRRAAISE